jgi:hypothetical protein
MTGGADLSVKIERLVQCLVGARGVTEGREAPRSGAGFRL